MDGCGVLLIFFLLIGVVAIIIKSMQPEKSGEQLRTEAYGPLNSEMVCPHCQKKGTVRRKLVTKKAGVSGGKATAALLTGGVSLLATGLSRKEDLTQAHCEGCGSTWCF